MCTKVCFDGIETEQVIGMCGDDFGRSSGGAAKMPGRRQFGRAKDEELAGGMAGGVGKKSFAVTASGGLGYGIETSQGAEDDWEINIHASLDELR